MYKMPFVISGTYSVQFFWQASNGSLRHRKHCLYAM